MKRGKKIVRSLQDKKIKTWRKFESNSFKYDSKRHDNVVNFADRVKHKSKIQTNGSQLEANIEGELTSSSNATCNISNYQLEISNIWEVVHDDIQKREIVDLEGVAETNFGQSYEINHIVTKLKDINRNNEKTDIVTQTIANMTVSKNDSDISNNNKYVSPSVSYANILKQPSGMRRPSNLPAYVPPQLNSPLSQVSELDFYLTQGDQSLLETLETLCGSVSTSSKFVDGRRNKSRNKSIRISPTPSINQTDLCRDISDLAEK